MRHGTIGEDENCSDGVDMVLDLCRDPSPVEFILPYTASVGQPRCVEDAKLGKRSHILRTFVNSRDIPLRHSYS